MQHNGRNKDLSGAPKGTWREVVTIAWPLVVSMLSYTFMSLADTLMVASLGTTEVAAVGIGATAYFAVTCFGMGLLNAVRVLVAQAKGRGESAQGYAVGWHGLLVALVMGMVLTGLIIFADPILLFLGGGGAVSALGASYFETRLLGLTPALLSMACFGFFEGLGQTRVPMRVRLFANALNVGLDYLLIFGVGGLPAMGVRGAALATTIALSVQAMWALWLFLRVPQTRPTWSRPTLSELCRLGGPMGIQWALEVQSWAIFAALVARMGEAHLAAHTIVVRIISVSFLPGHALGDATSILVGQAKGAGELAVARRCVRAATGVTVCVMGLLGLAFLGLGTELLSVFRPSPEVEAIGLSLMGVAALFQVFDGVLMTRTGALNGYGDTRYVMVASVAMAWFVLVPLAWFLCNGMGLGAPGAWGALSLQILLLSVLLWDRWEQKSHARAWRVARVA